MRMENPIFIVGLPRSGSTLWLNIITANPSVFRIGEILFLHPWHRDFRYFLRKKVGDLSTQENIEKMIRLIFSARSVEGISSAFWHYDIKEANNSNFRHKLVKNIYASDRSLEKIFKLLIEEFTQFKGYDRFCVKFPVSVNHVDDLLSWYPKSRIIHIIRDPRAMAVSRTSDPGGAAKQISRYPYLKWLIKKSRMYLAICEYIITSKLHERYSQFENYAVFKYEDLLSEPEKTILDLCKFAKIEFVPDMLEPQKGKEKGQKSSITGKRRSGFDQNAATRWLKVISPLDRVIISFLTRGSMKRFGYESLAHPVFKMN